MSIKQIFYRLKDKLQSLLPFMCTPNWRGIKCTSSFTTATTKIGFSRTSFFSLKLSEREQIKFWRIGVPIRDWFSSRVLKVCNPSRVEAWYWKLKFVSSQSTNTSLVQARSNTIVHTRILIRVMTFFSRNASLNNKIPYTWFNDFYNTFKVKCKQLLLP